MYQNLSKMFHKRKRHVTRVKKVDIVDEKGRTLLLKAAMFGDFENVKALLAKGADVNKKDNEEKFPLFIASSYGYTEIVEILLKNGANINLTDNSGRSSLNASCYLGRLETSKLLISLSKSLVNFSDERGRTPLIEASYNGFYSVADLLIKNGAKVNAVDSHGYSALQHAVTYGHFELTRLLIENDANPYISNENLKVVTWCPSITTLLLNNLEEWTMKTHIYFSKSKRFKILNFLKNSYFGLFRRIPKGIALSICKLIAKHDKIININND
jgi:ankyrin repeat protein